jgi:hypothetical protein
MESYINSRDHEAFYTNDSTIVFYLKIGCTLELCFTCIDNYYFSSDQDA